VHLLAIHSRSAYISHLCEMTNLQDYRRSASRCSKRRRALSGSKYKAVSAKLKSRDLGAAMDLLLT
jgi:hypothetical protein